MADCVQTELSEPFQRIVEIVRRHYSQEKQDVDKTREEVDEFLRRLRVALTRLAPPRPSVDAVYLTRDLADMSDMDLVYMVDASSDLLYVDPSGEYHGYDDPLMRQDQAMTGGSIVVEPGAPNDTLSLPSRHVAAIDDISPPCTATSDVVLDGLDNGTSTPMPIDHPNFSPTNVRCTTTPIDKQGKQRGQRQRRPSVQPKRRRSRSTLQKTSLSSTLYPTDKSTPGVRDLFDLLSPKHGADAAMLVYMFAETVALTTFHQFGNALQFFSSHQKIRLPRHSHGLPPLMDVLERIEGGLAVLHLCRSVALLRMREHYTNSERTIAADGSGLVSAGREENVRKKLATRTYDLLVREACASGVPIETKEKTRRRIRNHVAASRVWSSLCNAVGVGVLALIPKVAPSTLERVPGSAINVFLQFLRENAGSEILCLVSLLSDHLPAILEGDECNLAGAIVGGTAEDWRHLLVITQDLAPCLHPVIRR